MALAYENGRWSIDVVKRVHYEVVARRGILDQPPPALFAREGVKRRLVVIDARVGQIHAERCRGLLNTLDGAVATVHVETSEASKRRSAIDRIHDAAVDAELGRRDELIGIGGGVLLDLVGFAAAEYRKETPYVVVPTTLVGNVDAGVGGKRMINYARNGTLRKSLIGDYHPARLSVIDAELLGTLPPHELRAGLSEIKKVAEMVDGELFRLLEQRGQSLIETRFQEPIGDEVLQRSVAGILGQLSNDLWEQDLLRWPDHGHTVSPALELETGMSHGLAVAICSGLGAAVAYVLGSISDVDLRRMLGLSVRLGLPVWHPLLADRRFLERAIGATALVRNGNHWPLPIGIGRYTFVEPAMSAVVRASEVVHDFATTGAISPRKGRKVL